MPGAWLLLPTFRGIDSRRLLPRYRFRSLRADRDPRACVERTCASSLPTSSLGEFITHHQANGARHLTPAAGLADGLLPAPAGEPVEFCFAIFLARPPERRAPSGILKPMKSGVKRSLLDFQN